MVARMAGWTIFSILRRLSDPSMLVRGSSSRKKKWRLVARCSIFDRFFSPKTLNSSYFLLCSMSSPFFIATNISLTCSLHSRLLSGELLTTSKACWLTARVSAKASFLKLNCTSSRNRIRYLNGLCCRISTYSNCISYC